MNQRTESYKSGVIAIVGPTNAGKSTLLNEILGRKVSIVSSKPQTTRNRIVAVRHSDNCEMIFVDSPGFFRRNKQAALSAYLLTSLKHAAEGVDLTLLILDAGEIARRPERLSEIAAQMQDACVGAADIVVLNKIDTVDKRALLPIMGTLKEQLNLSGDFQAIPLSATKKDGIEILLQEIERRLPAAPQCYPEEMITDQSEEFFISEIVREKLFRKLHEELPYSTAVAVEKMEEGEKNGESLLGIKATIVVERESQKGIVVGKGGSMLKAIGTEARQELEKIMGTRIFLQLFVKVEPDWSRTSKGLNRAGLTSLD